MNPFHLKGSHRQNVTCLVSSESVGQKKCQKQLHKIVQGNAESHKFAVQCAFRKKFYTGLLHDKTHALYYNFLGFLVLQGVALINIPHLTSNPSETG